MKQAIPSAAVLEKTAISIFKSLISGFSTVLGLENIKIAEAPRQLSGFDFSCSVRLKTNKTIELLIQVKKEVRPSLFPYLSLPQEFNDSKHGRLQIPVLASPNISPRMAELCSKSGWSWFDFAGNCKIVIPGYLVLERTGNKPLYESPKPIANLGTAHAARVIRALLAPENAGKRWTQFQLQKECYPEVSIGLVNKIIGFLKGEKYIAEKETGGVQLADPMGLLEAWKKAYRFDQHTKVNYFSLFQANPLLDALLALDKKINGHVTYASFSAAEIQAPQVRLLKLWLYLDPKYDDLFRKFTDAKPVDSGENIIVFYPSDNGVFYLTDKKEDRISCTNPIQTYVDLLHSGGRGEEAAEAILDQRLKPAWKEHGLL